MSETNSSVIGIDAKVSLWDAGGNVIYITDEQEGAKDGSLGDPDSDMARVTGSFIIKNTLSSVVKIALYQINRITREVE